MKKIMILSGAGLSAEIGMKGRKSWTRVAALTRGKATEIPVYTLIDFTLLSDVHLKY